MDWFSVGINPLVIFLERRLTGIPLINLPVLGPVLPKEEFPIPPVKEVFNVMAFCDDIKPALTNIEEFVTADNGAKLLELSAGTKLHRDPSTNKCKFLPLGKWRRELSQEDIPTDYMRISDTLDMVGAQLCASWAKT